MTDSATNETTAFGYDRNGNQTSKTVTTSTGSTTTTYLFDERDKLVEALQGSSSLEKLQYCYDGKRTQKIGLEGIRQYFYDDDSLLLEYDDIGASVAKYDYGSDRLISLVRRDELRRFYSFDGLRSVVNLSADDGAAVASYHLDAWGNYRFPMELDASKNRFGFTGYELDGETGLYNAKARYFDPEFGRFMTQDSVLGQIDNPPSLHRYFYGNANPVRYVDPTGHYAVAGHYYTVYLVARQVGFSGADAARLALYTQLPDLTTELDATSLQAKAIIAETFGRADAPERAARRDSVQRELHALTGAASNSETEVTVAAIRGAGNDLRTVGLLLHRLGDTFAHRRVNDESRTYETGWGHLEHWAGPDTVLERPGVYLEYVRTLTGVLAEKRGLSATETTAALAQITPLGVSFDVLPVIQAEDRGDMRDEIRALVQGYLVKERGTSTGPSGKLDAEGRARLTNCLGSRTCAESAFTSHIKAEIRRVTGGDAPLSPENLGIARDMGMVTNKPLAQAIEEASPGADERKVLAEIEAARQASARARELIRAQRGTP